MNKHDLIEVGIITRDMGIGGAERFIIHLVNNIDKSKFQPSIVILDREKKHQLESVRLNNRNIYINPYHRNDPRSIFWLVKWMKGRDVNISFLERADIMASLSAFLSGFRNLIVTERGGRINRYHTGFKKWLMEKIDYWLVFRVGRLAVSNSFEGKRSLIRSGCPEEKIEVIPNGIELGDSSGKSILEHTEPFTIGFMGRLVPFKGVDTVIQAIGYLVKHLDRPIKVLIAGDGPERTELEKLAQRIGLEKYVTFLGNVHNHEDFYPRLDLGVIASKPFGTESFPNVLLEYWKYGVPVICSDIQPLLDLVRDRETVMVFKHGDEKELSEKLEELVYSKSLRELLVSNAIQEVADKYNIQDVIDRYEDLFQQYS